MAASPSFDLGRAARARTARPATKGGAATCATIALVLAGTAVPATAAQIRGNCGASTAAGMVSCVYDDPAVTGYVLRVPAGVTEVYIEATGAAGGAGGTISPRVPAPHGGSGGLVAAGFPVVPGDLLRILVGGHGNNADGMKPGAGGVNGGAKGGAGAAGGGGGGGASSVRLRGTDDASRILVAGGGGGGGGSVNSAAAWSARGGAGGGERGENGSGDFFGPGGIGAVGPSGGAGLQRVTGLDGHSGYDQEWGGGGGEGGNGTANAITASCTCGGNPVGAGGGGGGYAGGGGGATGATLGGGGGGGSGFVATSFLAPTVARLGSARLLIGKNPHSDGQVVITYRIPTDPRPRSGIAAAPDRSAVATDNQQHETKAHDRHRTPGAVHPGGTRPLRLRR